MVCTECLRVGVFERVYRRLTVAGGSASKYHEYIPDKATVCRYIGLGADIYSDTLSLYRGALAPSDFTVAIQGIYRYSGCLYTGLPTTTVVLIVLCTVV